MHENIVRHEIAQTRGSTGGPVVAIVVFRRFITQNQSHHIRWVPIVQLLLKNRVDHVVRRSHNVFEGTHSGKVVAEGSKRLNIGHVYWSPEDEVMVQGGSATIVA